MTIPSIPSIAGSGSEHEDNVLATSSVLVNLDGTPITNGENQESPRTPPESVIPGSAGAVRRHVLSLDLEAPRDVSSSVSSSLLE